MPYRLGLQRSARLRAIVARRCAAALFFVAALTSEGCKEEIYYSADPITGTVVDADTKQPLAGVNVLASWTAYGGGLEGGNLTGHAMVLEAVTDENGKFSLPGWGPKRLNFSGLIRNNEPLLVLFKSGYKAQGWSNSDAMHPAPHHMQSEWNGKTLELKKFEGSADEYAQDLSLFLGSLIESFAMPEECNLKAIPKFLLALDQQHQEFARQHTKINVRSVNGLSESYRRKCGSLEQYVREHG